MSKEIWAVWPTIVPVRSCEMIDRWHERGYKVALLVNPPLTEKDFPEAERVIVQDEWVGFPIAVNILCRNVAGEMVVVVGDDVYPEPHKTAQEIGEKFMETFHGSFGVMQPTGDKFAHTHLCAVTPWIGRTFIKEAYGGLGPFWEGYFHYFCDEELQKYATQLGVFQQREDITQYHDHWQRGDDPHRPRYLRKAKRYWKRDKDLFEERKQKGFPWRSPA